MVHQELEYVGFWPRLGATLLDSLLMVMLCAPFQYFFYGTDYWVSHTLVHGPVDFLITWVLPAIAAILFWKYRQATPGKMAIGARIVDARTGLAPSSVQWVVRYFSYIVSIVPLCLGFVWIALSPRKQAWHDLIAGTVVVRKRRGQGSVEFDDP